MSSSASKSSKRQKIMTPSECLQTPEPPQRVEFSSSSSSLLSTPMHFPSSPPVFRPLIFQSPRLPEPRKSSPQRHKVLKRRARASSPIASSEGIEATLLATCQSIENAEKEGLDGAPVYFCSEEEANNVFLDQLSSDESLSEDNNDKNDNEQD